jgi:hypothetical protein
MAALIIETIFGHCNSTLESHQNLGFTAIHLDIPFDSLQDAPMMLDWHSSGN